MQKILSTLGLLVCIQLFSLSIFAQSPESVNYQAVARNLSGVPLVNQSVDVRFTIHQATAVGPSVFQETHATSTNNFGLINLALGSVNTIDFSVINWSLGTFFLQVELDDGSGFVDMGSTQLLSVPYALYAETSGDGPAGLNSLMQSTVEPVGANCTNGGYFVQSWLDVDDDGTLSAGETSIDYYICNGLDGVNGTNGTNGVNGNDGVGIDSTIHNADGTLTIYYSNSTTYNSNDITGPMGPAGTSGTVYTEGTGISLLGDSITNLGDADNDPTNEIELPATAVASEVLTWNGSAWVAQLPSTGDDWGTEVVNVSGTNISGDGTILDPIVVTDADNDPTNELELPMTGNTLGDVLQWDGSNWVSQAAASGADDWGTQVVVTDGTLTGNGTSGTPLSGFDGDYGSLSNAPTIPANTSDLTNDSGFITNADDADNDPTNEIELPATATTNQVLTWDGSAWVAQNAGSGADNWGSQLVQVDGTTITGDGDTTPLSGFDGDYGSLSNTPIIPANTSDLTNDSGFITNANDGDFDPTNEIELPATASTNDVLIWDGSNWVAGTAAADGDGNSTNEIQNLSVAGNNLNISGGTGTTISATAPTTGDMLYWNGLNWVSQAVPADNVDDADNDPNNEIELPSTASTNDVLIWNGSNWVAGTTAADGDGNSTNEIQSLTYVSGSQNLSISGGNSVTLIVDDADANATNEIQTLSFADPNLTLSNGGGTIDLSGLSPTTYWSPNATDIYSNNTGNVGVGITPLYKLDVSGDINTNGVYRIDGTTFLDNKASSTQIGATGNTALTGLYNTLVGELAGQQITTGLRNTLLGRSSGNKITTESDNTLIGLGAGSSLTGGVENTMLGSYAGWSLTNTGTGNTYIGANTAHDNTTGSSNVFLGSSSGYSITTGSNNTFLGYWSGRNNTTGTGNIFLGNHAGENETGSNHLYIDNSNTASPLIWGDFSANLLRVNGKLNINNAYSFPIVDGGAAGLTLITDGVGNVSWGTPSAAVSPWTDGGSDIFQTTLTDFVGIGTNAPTEMLSVGSLGTATGVGTQQSSYKMALTGSYWNGGAIAHDFVLSNQASTVTAEEGRLAIGWSGTGSELMSITSTGKVGIGISNPVSSFNVIYTGTDAEASLVNYTNNSAAASGTGYFVGVNNTGTGAITAGGFQVNSSGNSSETKAIDAVNIAAGGNNYGIKSVATGGGSSNYGGSFSASGANSSNYGLSSNAFASGTSNATGIYSDAGGSGTGVTYGVYGQNSSSSTGVSYGGYFRNMNSQGAIIYGVRSQVTGASTTDQYGYRADVTGASSGTKYGLYSVVANGTGTQYGIFSDVSGGSTNWAAYFAAGDVFVADNLVIPTNAGPGKVLSSVDASGTAQWENSAIGTAFHVFLPGDQAIAGGTGTVINFAAEDFDDGTNFSTTLFQFKAPTDGVYHFDTKLTYNTIGGSAGYCGLDVYKNNATRVAQDIQGAVDNYQSVSASFTIRLNAGDFIDVRAYTQIARQIQAGSDYTYFSGYRVY